LIDKTNVHKYLFTHKINYYGNFQFAQINLNIALKVEATIFFDKCRNNLFEQC